MAQYPGAPSSSPELTPPSPPRDAVSIETVSVVLVLKIQELDL